MKKRNIDPRKSAGYHPIINEMVDLKWYRGANRYNNGATRYGKKYLFRFIISSLKEKLK